jgi:cysteine desulfurase
MTRDTYLDYAATTPVDERVLEAMTPYYTSEWGNPNSLYTRGRSAFAALEDARSRVAEGLGAADPREVVFAGCGTESDNSAVIGIARAASARGEGTHVVVSAFEHHAVLEAARSLEREGLEVTRVAPREDGIVYAEDLRRSVRKGTVLVSIMHVNNELGTVQPIQGLAGVAHEVGAYFHTDAVQGVGRLPFDVEELGVDAASFSAHKIYGPKGVGVLYLRKGTPFQPYLLGGGQEAKRRSGTQNVAGAVAFATALGLMLQERVAEGGRLNVLAEKLIMRMESIENVTLNGSRAARVPHIANFTVEGVEGESMLLHLDAQGIAVSTGSACSSASLEPSHVLLAIGCPPELAHGSLRVSMGRFTTPEDVDTFLDVLPPIIERLRSMSPVYGKRSGPG